MPAGIIKELKWDKRKLKQGEVHIMDLDWIDLDWIDPG